MSMDSAHKPLSKAATDAGMKFAMDAMHRMPKDDPQALEAHITALLIVFWAALWGTQGTQYARDFIEAQLRGMQDDGTHEVFTPPSLQ